LLLSVPPESKHARKIAKYIQLLKHEREDKRKKAIKVLQKYGAESVPHLIHVLFNSQSSADEEIIINALGQMGAVAVEPLLELFTLSDESVTAAAIQALVMIGDEGVEPLIRALRHNHPAIRAWAITNLARMQDPRAVGPLISVAYQDPEEALRQAALKGLAKMGEAVIDPLIQVIRTTSHTQVWKGAGKILARLGIVIVEPFLQTFRKEKDEDVLERLATALAEVGPAAIDPLVQALKHKSETVRMSSAFTLTVIGSEAVVPLIEALKDESAKTRLCAIVALEEIGDKQAIEPLREALEQEDDSHNQQLIREALKTLEGQPKEAPKVDAEPESDDADYRYKRRPGESWEDFAKRQEEQHRKSLQGD
jgi:HEAT repeat protein